MSAVAFDRVTGAITPLSGSPFPAGGGPHAVAVDPYGRLVYVANKTDNSISGYRIGADGTLAPLVASPFAAGQQPSSASIDPTGRFLYVANSGADTLSVYAINAGSGALTVLPGAPLGTGSVPLAIAVSD